MPCFVSLSLQDPPDLSSVQVKELVRVQIENRRPIRAPWYRGNDIATAAAPESCGAAGNSSKAVAVAGGGTGVFLGPSSN
jgi:hypothetical protein